VHEHAISDHGRDNILEYFLTTIAPVEESFGSSQDLSRVLAALAGFEVKSEQGKDRIAQRIQELAHHLLDDFFLPRKFV
jgi:hypothetical protein